MGAPICSVSDGKGKITRVRGVRKTNKKGDEMAGPCLWCKKYQVSEWDTLGTLLKNEKLQVLPSLP